MKTCTVCSKKFDPDEKGSEPAVEMGAFLGENVLKDGEELCSKCLASRGTLGMMYLRDLD